MSALAVSASRYAVGSSRTTTSGVESEREAFDDLGGALAAECLRRDFAGAAPVTSSTPPCSSKGRGGATASSCVC